jgi:predicted DNA binding CopG/RHH family protein
MGRKMIKNEEYSIPKFNNIEEEDKFWQSHSPLMEGHKGKVQKKKQNRASFLSIRLADKELAQLREQALRYGLGSSTYARQLIIQKLESNIDPIPVDLVYAVSRNSFINDISAEQREKYFHELNKMYESYLQIQEEMVKKMLRVFPSNMIAIKEDREESQEKVTKH